MLVGAGWPPLKLAKMPVVGVGTGWLLGRAKTPVGVGEGGLLGWAWAKMPVVGVVEAGWPPLERAKMPVVGAG